MFIQEAVMIRDALNNIAAAIRELAAAQRQEYSEDVGEPQQVETYLDGTPVK